MIEPAFYYECGCSETHALRDTPYTHVAPIVNFIFYCENGFMTVVKIKGVFRLRVTSNTLAVQGLGWILTGKGDQIGKRTILSFRPKMELLLMAKLKHKE